MRKLLVGFMLFIMFAVSVGYADDSARSIAVAGFINQGEKQNDTIQVVIAKSIITFLSKIPQVKVTSYDESLKVATESQFFKDKKIDVEKVLGIGLQLNAKQVIAGEYFADTDNNKITIRVYVFDTVTGDLKLKRNYEGATGVELFDTIDNMTKNLTFLLLGKQIKMGKLNLSIDKTDSLYDLYIGGNKQALVSNGAPYGDIIIAEEKIEVSLKISGTDTEVLRSFINIKENETTNIVYIPSGTVIVKNMQNPEAKVMLDDVEVGQTDINGNFNIYNVTANQSHTVKLVKDEKVIGSKTVTLKEGEMPIMVFGDTGERKFYFPVRVSLYGGIGASAGFEFYLTSSLKLSVLGGANIILTADSFYTIPMADVNISFSPVQISDFKLWLNVSGLMYIANTVVFNPALSLSVEWNHIYVLGGMRYSFDEVYSGFKPIIGLGLKF